LCPSVKFSVHKKYIASATAALSEETMTLSLFDIAAEVGAGADVDGATAVEIGVSDGRPDVRAPVVGWAV
jgi:hypothetical protein